MPSPEGQDVLTNMMRPKTGASGTGKAGAPFGRPRKKAKRATRKPAGRKAGARKPAARKPARRAKKKR